MNKQQTLIQRILSSQRSFFLAGITFGIAQIIYMLGLWTQETSAGQNTVLTPITVTTDLGNMFRGVEVALYQLFNLHDFEIYGKSIDAGTSEEQTEVHLFIGQKF